MLKKRRRPKKLRPVKQSCNFCKENKDPSYRDVEIIRRFVTDRGRIVGRARSGICAKHQRKVTASIKHARHLGLLPFTVGIY